MKEKRLLVICEPAYDHSTGCTKNLAMNEILYSYQNFFNQVHCITPGVSCKVGMIGEKGVFYHTVDGYNGNKINKFLYQFRRPKINIEDLVNQNGITHIQLRVPSTFSLAFYEKVKKIENVIVTTYIAGDVYDNLVMNFKHIPMIKLIARFMEKRQDVLLKNSIVVTTGDVLKEKYNDRNKNIHAFYSTTHNDVILENYSYNDDVLSLVFVGRVDVAKRLDILVDVVKKLKERNVFVNVNIIGDGSQLSSIKQKVSNFNLNNQFVFYGYVSDRKFIDSILLKSSIFILSSVTEGTAKVLPEAMSRGVIPIAVRNVGSNNFIVNDGVNGLLVNSNNYLEIVDFIQTLDSERDRIRLIQEKAYEYASSKTAKIEIEKMWKFIFDNSI